MTLPPAEDYPGVEQTWNPPYEQPAVTVRATWSATDGSRPEEVTVEWRVAPSPEEIREVVTMLLAREGEVYASAGVDGYSSTMVTLDDPSDPAATAQLPALCGETGMGHDGPAHYCAERQGHDPVEPGGRAHRCRCGGLFATDDEVPDVPGRASRGRSSYVGRPIRDNPQG